MTDRESPAAASPFAMAFYGEPLTDEVTAILRKASDGQALDVAEQATLKTWLDKEKPYDIQIHAWQPSDFVDSLRDRSS